MLSHSVPQNLIINNAVYPHSIEPSVTLVYGMATILYFNEQRLLRVLQESFALRVLQESFVCIPNQMHCMALQIYQYKQSAPLVLHATVCGITDIENNWV